MDGDRRRTHLRLEERERPESRRFRLRPDRQRPDRGATPPRYPTDIFVDRKNPNHAWITFSGYNSKTPATPGHVFEVFYSPNASTFALRDGDNRNNGFGDIPANAIVQTDGGTVYVGTDYGVVVRENNQVWRMARQACRTSTRRT